MTVNHGCKSILQCCISSLEPTSAKKYCTNRTVNEFLLQEVTVKAFNQILSARDVFLKTLQRNIAKAIETLVSRLIAKITVFNDHCTVEFKSGVAIDIEA